MTMLYPNLCSIEVCFKGTAMLFCNFYHTTDIKTEFKLTISFMDIHAKLHPL